VALDLAIQELLDQLSKDIQELHHLEDLVVLDGAEQVEAALVVLVRPILELTAQQAALDIHGLIMD
jgi:hypothetical protein